MNVYSKTRCSALFALMFMMMLAGGRPRAAGTIFSSQIGYAPDDPKSAVLAVPSGTVVDRSFRVISEQGQIAYSSAPEAAVPYPGGWIGNDAVGDTYLLDFSAATLPDGRYRIESNGSYSPYFDIGTDVYDVSRMSVLEFFRIQQSGVPYSWTALDGAFGGHGADHLDDSRKATRRDKGGGDNALIQQDYLTLPGGRLDVSGGWSDAGDYNKYMGNTPWAAYLLLLTGEEHRDYWQTVDDNHNGMSDIQEVVQPALEWMLKMQHTDGSTYERVFNGYGAQFDGRPDLETDNVAGTSDDRPLDSDRYADITAKSTYAWALGFRVFNDMRYLTAAERAWDWALANQTRVKPQVYGGGLYFGDVEIGLTLGALELHRAQAAAGWTPDPKYLAYASAHVRTHLDAGNWTNPSSWDFQQSQTLMRYYDLASPADQQRILSQIGGRWDWALQNQARNAYRMNDEWLYGDFGQNELSASGANDALWLYRRTGDRRYYDYAVNQMSWIFGRNPFGESWLATERATEYTRVPHWRATAKHPVAGVVVPGATDRNGNGRPDYTDTGEWFYSEPTINQQAMFLRAMTALYVESGGTVNPPANLPPSVLITSPTSGSVVQQTITIAASISDPDGLVAVTYQVDEGGAVSMSLASGTPQNGVWEATLDTRAIVDGQHQITVTARDNSGLDSMPSVAVSVRNSTEERLHVERIDTVLNKKGGSRLQARCDAFVYDAFGIPVPGATVSGHWSGAATDTFSVTTDSIGKAVDYSNSSSAPSGSVYTCSVDGITKTGWQYDPDANRQTSASVIVP